MWVGTLGSLTGEQGYNTAENSNPTDIFFTVAGLGEGAFSGFVLWSLGSICVECFFLLTAWPSVGTCLLSHPFPFS